ncbi:LPS assembly lipoprotein LptE [Allopusillimonas ginsengisoli]|uniref:LPS-assembly lipoprotein LptE n=1 Tax=Allopusillimonas ginsengisoli TaxID=453575 RepID=UPI0039C21A1F
MKGVSPLPFTTLYTNISENSEFGAGLRRAILASSPGTRFVSDPAMAQARLEQLDNSQSLRELSLDADGSVEEYELNINFVFQLTNAQGGLVLPPTTLHITREVPYNAQQVQAKQSEIGVVFMQMRQSLVDRIVRHLSAPAVSEAFANPEALPFNELPTPDVPANEPETPTPWSDPSQRSGSGFF